MASERREMNGEELSKDNELWRPPEVERLTPVDGEEDIPTEERPELNYDGAEVLKATEEELEREIETYGRLLEPEMLREEEKPVPPKGVAFGMGYSDTYWTHFDFRADVRGAIARVQKKVPWLTYANTYYRHPPVYGRKYEFVSNDYWGGGRVNGRYAGYRGKPIGNDLGWKVFNAVFNDPARPNIAWIIFGGRMWTRGYGWGPAPGGPAGSDAGHYFHVHCTYVL
jgi:hypothetical protein